MSLGKDTQLKTLFTIIGKDQYDRLQTIATMRRISKSKLIREIIEDYLKRLLVLGQEI